MQLTEVGGVPDDKNYRKILSRSLVSLNLLNQEKIMIF